MPRKISKPPLDLVSKPAISGAHVGDTDVVLNEEYDCNFRVWDELPSIPSELLQHAKPSTVSGLELEDQEPTVDKGNDTLLELATIGDSIARILESASDPSPLSTTSTSTTTSNKAITTVTTNSTLLPSETLFSKNRTIWVPKSHHLPSFSSSRPSPPKRFQRSPFFGKKIGVTPRVSRIASVSGALDPEMPAFESSVGNETAGSTIGGGSDNELEAHSEDVEITPIELKEGGFDDFGGENGGRPFVAILADLRALLGHEPCKPNRHLPYSLKNFSLIGVCLSLASSIRTISSPSTSLLSIEEGYEWALAKIVELRGCLERT